MSEAVGAGAGASEDVGGFFSNLMKSLSSATEGKEDQLAIIADTLGQRIAPNNIFGGIGTAMAKSKMAGEKIESDQQESATFIKEIIDKLNNDKTDLNQVKLKRDPNNGELTIVETSVVPKKIDEVSLPKPKEKSAATSDFKKLPANPLPDTVTPGSMNDLYNTYLGDSNGE